MGTTPHHDAPLEQWNPADPGRFGIYLCPECGIEGFGPVMLAHICKRHKDVARRYIAVGESVTTMIRHLFADGALVEWTDTTRHLIRAEVLHHLDRDGLIADVEVGEPYWPDDKPDAFGMTVPLAVTNVRERAHVDV